LPKDTFVIVGAPPLMMIMKRLHVVGSVVGTLRDVEEALDFTARGLVHVSLPALSPFLSGRSHTNSLPLQPILTKGELNDLDHYFHLMTEGKLVGRDVFKIS